MKRVRVAQLQGTSLASVMPWDPCKALQKQKPQLTNLHLRGLKEMRQQPWQPSNGGHDALPFLGRPDS